MPTNKIERPSISASGFRLSSLMSDPSSIPHDTHGYLMSVPASSADIIRHANRIAPAWVCVGASKDLCHLAFLAEARTPGEGNSHYVGVCEAPEDHVYCLFASPMRSAYTMVVAHQSLLNEQDD